MDELTAANERALLGTRARGKRLVVLRTGGPPRIDLSSAYETTMGDIQRDLEQNVA